MALTGSRLRLIVAPGFTLAALLISHAGLLRIARWADPPAVYLLSHHAPPTAQVELETLAALLRLVDIDGALEPGPLDDAALRRCAAEHARIPLVLPAVDDLKIRAGRRSQGWTAVGKLARGGPSFTISAFGSVHIERSRGEAP